MTTPNFFMLYVEAPEASARFYADLFAVAPVEVSPTFALFILEAGFKFGLWARHGVEPAPRDPGCSGEVVFMLADASAVDATFQSWSRKGLSILQQPVAMDFGYTFVALDPDGHRLRVYAMAEG